MRRLSRLLSLMLSVIMILGILPASSLAAETDAGNNAAGPVEEWIYHPSDETADGTPRLFSARSADASLSASAALTAPNPLVLVCTLRPDATASRAQIAKMIVTFLNETVCVERDEVIA